MVTDEVRVPRSRRALLAAAFGAVAATAAEALGRPSAKLATDGQPVIQGQANGGTQATVTSNTASTGLSGESHAPDSTGLVGIAWAVTGSAFGIESISNGPTGGGVRGEGHTGVLGLSSAPNGTVLGVHGLIGSPAGAGVKGENMSTDLARRGVIGQAAAGCGVHGFAGPGDPGSPAGTCGVHGECNINAFASGVRGLSTPGVGVYGQTATGIGLVGKATIQGAGESGLYLRGVVRNVPNNKFTIKLSKAVSANLPIAWFIGS